MTQQIPRAEYPRPQMMRDSWMNLNGTWDFAFDFSVSGKEREQYLDGAFPEKITVPFCPESRLSGIGYTDFIPAVWYRRTVKLTAEQIGGRVLMQFGAVDYHCEVWANGQHCGSHDGGYSSFAIELTGALREGENTLVVYAEDDLRSGNQPAGKQSTKLHSHACSYTRTTGIWQTVWLEFLPSRFIGRYEIVPQYRDSSANVTVIADGDAFGCSVRVTAKYGGKVVGSGSASIHAGRAQIALSLSESHLWEIGSPELYDLTLELMDGGTVVDTAEGYFGLRGVELHGGAIHLNGKPVFQRLILDQGFNPEGIYTAPDDAFLKRDIELAMELGFNGARLHERVFEERFLYWADKLGYLVWGEHANWGLAIRDAAAIDRFLPEWTEVVRRDFNHPSVVGWCPFNETWDTAQDPAVVKTIYRATKQLDPTRPVIDTSGEIHYETDIYDIHHYEQDPAKFAALFEPMKDGGPAYRRFTNNGIAYPGQPMPFFVSEYGGTWWNPTYTSDEGGSFENRNITWGYGARPQNVQEVVHRYEGLTATLLEHPMICAFCYTQLTDVEQEQNGLYSYDRSRKFPDEIYDRIRAANTAPAAIEK